MKHINDYPLLTKTQTEKLALEVQKGNKEALNYLMLCNTRLVITIAKKMQKKSNCGHVKLEDLIQYGNEGLYEACMGFDPSKGSFAGYAGKYIRHTIKRNVQNYESVIRYPISFQNRLLKYNLALQELSQQLGREPSINEISEKAGITKAQVVECQKHNAVSSIDQTVGDDHATSISDLIQDPSVDSTKIYATKQLSLTIDNIIKEKLTDRERWIILIRTGLYDGDKHTLEEIGNAFGLSRERIRQIYNAGLKKLRDDPEICEKLKEYLD